MGYTIGKRPIIYLSLTLSLLTACSAPNSPSVSPTSLPPATQATFASSSPAKSLQLPASPQSPLDGTITGSLTAPSATPNSNSQPPTDQAPTLVISGSHLSAEMAKLLDNKTLALEANWQDSANWYRKRMDTQLNSSIRLQNFPIGLPIEIKITLPYLKLSQGTDVFTLDFPTQNIVLKSVDSKAELFVEQRKVEPAVPVTPPLRIYDDCNCIEHNPANGRVFDDTNSPLDGVRITAKSLNSLVRFDAETTTAGGAYAFNDAPSGVQVELIASKAGFSTRRQVVVLKSNKLGDPNANKHDFGTDGSSTTYGSVNNALSDKPEVMAVAPGRNSSGILPNSSVIVKWSEPIDRKSVEDTFTVRAFNSRQLTVDLNSGSNTFNGDSMITTITNDRVWDKNAYNILWNSDDTEVTFAFKEEKLLPTDKDSNLVPDYQVVFNGGGGRTVKDKAGITRSSNHFKLTDGPFEESYKFSIKTDEGKPDVINITAQTTENQGTNGDAVKVQFSEPMLLFTQTRAIAGGMADRKAGGLIGTEFEAPAGYPDQQGNATPSSAAENYFLTITRGNPAIPVYTGTWKALGGTAIYDPNDVTHRTVLLLPPNPTIDLYKPGDTVKVKVAGTVMDPAGNTINTSRDNTTASAS